MNFRIINKDGKSICPKCSGLLIQLEPLVMKCFDCKQIYKAIGTAIFDAEMVYTDGEENE